MRGETTLREVMTIVQLHGFVPVVDRWRPRNDIVSRDPSKFPFQVKQTITAGLAFGGQFQRSTTARVIRLQVIKVVVAIKKNIAAVIRAKRMLWPHIGAVGPRDMIRHEVDDHLESMLAAALKQTFELIHPFLGIHRVIRADIEVVLDRIGASRNALEDVGIIRRTVRVCRTAGLLQHTGEPNVREAHRGDRSERSVIDLCKFPASVFGHRAARLADLVGVAKGPHEKLVNDRTLRFVAVCQRTHAEKQNTNCKILPRHGYAALVDLEAESSFTASVKTAAMSMQMPPMTTALRRLKSSNFSITRLSTIATRICGITMKKLKIPM